MLREQWLHAAAEIMRPWFKKIDMPLPAKFRVTCGWPSTGALARQKRRIGEAWCSAASADDVNEVFISPCLADPVTVLATLLHELIHVADNCQHQHRGPFRDAAISLGLEGKMTATVPGAELIDRLKREVLKQLEPYPHAQLDMTLRPTKKQSTRMLKIVCPECGYTVRTSQKWLEHGLPTCACGEQMKEAA